MQLVEEFEDVLGLYSHPHVISDPAQDAANEDLFAELWEVFFGFGDDY